MHTLYVEKKGEEEALPPYYNIDTTPRKIP
jgi:hypothetical protein